ncbi:synaptojanin-2-binding protein-like [Acanthaster planci]|uniref:Synaptojanin-2-binding protein n=1 Tax=Acanthaster planci TaxID=133434 RepID=A0A8B7YR17_ACAPL|nr:synaptojanin-2-binding protein-like [Acanthaster planci]
MDLADVPEDRIELERGTTGLGFNIKGGRDQPHVPRDPGIFVTKIRDDGAAAKDGRLQKGDKILEINDKDVRNVPHQDAVNEFVNSGEKVVLVVQHGAEDILREKYAISEAAKKPLVPEGTSWKWVAVVGAGLAAIGAIYFVIKYRKH